MKQRGMRTIRTFQAIFWIFFGRARLIWKLGIQPWVTFSRPVALQGIRGSNTTSTSLFRDTNMRLYSGHSGFESYAVTYPALIGTQKYRTAIQDKILNNELNQTRLEPRTFWSSWQIVRSGLLDGSLFVISGNYASSDRISHNAQQINEIA